MVRKKKTIGKHINLDLFKPGKITVYVYIIVICLIIGFAILSFVSNINKTDKYKTQAIDDCVALCNERLMRNEMASTGPCLSESIAPGWVCDSVNIPRNDYADNLKENQCESYNSGINKRFVEVSTACDFLRTN